VRSNSLPLYQNGIGTLIDTSRANRHLSTHRSRIDLVQ